jgi:hypothetical protein
VITMTMVKHSMFVLLAIWGLVVGSGLFFLEAYATLPGDAGSPPIRWPEDSLVRRNVHRSTLLFFVHPQCPCSRASVEELRYILSQCGNRVAAHAILLSPAHGAGSWGDSEIEQELAALPDIQIWHDSGGQKARRFGVETSGHVVLYDLQGRLTYSGGITAARGHTGDNVGRSAVIDEILGIKRPEPGIPVFGCPLSGFGPPVGEESRR